MKTKKQITVTIGIDRLAWIDKWIEQSNGELSRSRVIEMCIENNIPSNMKRGLLEWGLERVESGEKEK